MTLDYGLIESRIRRFLKRPFGRLLTALVFAILSSTAALFIDRHDVLGLLKARVMRLLPQEDAQHVTWRRVSTHYHQLQVAEIQVARNFINGGSLAEVGQNILLASPQGHLSYLDSEHRLHSLDASVPMNIEGLRQSPLYDDPNFRFASLRTMDLLVTPMGDGLYAVYASHDRFSERCSDFVVSKLLIRSVGSTITSDGDWVDVWTAKGCLEFGTYGRLLTYPPMSGGRLLQLSDDVILVSIGDYNHVGLASMPSVAMNTGSDYGKLVAINLSTGEGRQYAIGLRNPQGLAFDWRGRVWETEHGPQGGDELNLMREGENYGWPLASFGMDYTTPPRRWPATRAIGSHAGYARPRIAFLPSIGISNLVAANTGQFPYWKNSLLVTSLRAKSVFVVKIDGDDVVFTEPIVLNRRLRDIAVLHDGSLAILADRGVLILVRNAENPKNNEGSFDVAGLYALPPPSPEEAPQQHASDAEEGRATFNALCARCHSASGQSAIGPPLNGIIGRDIASTSDFGYSDALQRLHARTWTTSRLREFILDPDSVAPGTRMPTLEMRPQDPKLIVEYLRTTKTRVERAGGQP